METKHLLGFCGVFFFLMTAVKILKLMFSHFYLSSSHYLFYCPVKFSLKADTHFIVFWLIDSAQ